MIYKIKEFKNIFSLLLLFSIGILSVLCVSSFMNYAATNQQIQKDQQVLKDDELYLINPRDAMKSKLNANNTDAYFKYEYRTIGDRPLMILKTNRVGIEYGFPFFEGSLQFIRVEQKSYREGTIYANIDLPGAEKISGIRYPSNLFTAPSYPEELVFVIDNNLDPTASIFISNSPEIIDYASEHGILNNGDSISNVATGRYLKSAVRNDIFFILFSIVSLLPILFSILVFSIINKYQIDKRYNEIVIRKIFFSPNKLIKRVFFGEQSAIIIFSLIASLIITVPLGFIKPFFQVDPGIMTLYFLLCYLLIGVLYHIIAFAQVSRSLKKIGSDNQSLILKEVDKI